MGRARITQRSVEIANHRSVVIEAGDGPVVVIVASMAARGKTYLSLIKALAKKYRVIVTELPGSGGASKLASPWHFQQYSRYLTALLEHLDVDAEAIIGHSNSGPVALMTAVRLPHRVKRLVMVGSVGADYCVSLLSLFAGRAVDALLELPLTLSAWHHVAWNAIRHTRNFLEQIRLAIVSNAVVCTRHVTVPTLLAWGRRDHTTPLRCAQRLYEALGRSQMYVFPKGSHDWLMLYPREFAETVDRFIDDTAIPSEPSAGPVAERLRPLSASQHRNPSDAEARAYKQVESPTADARQRPEPPVRDIR